MCLNTIGSINLEFNEKEDCFVGYGYKKMSSEIYMPCGRISPTLVKKTPLGAAKKLERGWYEASGYKSFERSMGDVDNTRLLSDGTYYKKYFPGFHIFLNARDAEKYLYGGSGPIVKVMFNEVTAFGTNETSPYQYGECVVAKYMKIVEKVNVE